MRCIAALLGVMLFCSCTRKKPEVEGYRVVGYDAPKGQWTIIRNGTFDGKYLRKRIIAVCDFYQWGNHEAVKGPTACDLRVGQMIVPNPLPKEGQAKDFLDIWEMSPDRLSITAGDGADKVNQQFIILKEEVVSD